MSDITLKLDRRYLQIILAIVIAIPYFVPIDLPIAIPPETMQGFEFIEALPEGSVILMSYDASSAGMAEVHPQGIAMMRYGMRKNFKIIWVSTWVEGPQLIEWLLNDVQAFEKMEYGVDFVTIGYLPGGAGGVAAFANDIHALIKEDYYGNTLEELPMMADIRDATDIDLIFDVCVGGGFTSWLWFVQAVYGTPMFGAVSAWAAPTALPFLASGQIVGLNNGLGGAAAFEKLTGTYGFGQGGLTSLSFAHVWTILVIIIANILSVITKERGEK